MFTQKLFRHQFRPVITKIIERMNYAVVIERLFPATDGPKVSVARYIFGLFIFRPI